MYYHAIRVSSVAMCSTGVWDASVLFSGLPLLFPFVLLCSGKVPDVGSAVHICSGKVPVVSSFPTTCRRVCQTHEMRWFACKTRNAETEPFESSWRLQWELSSWIGFMLHTDVALSEDVLILETLTKQPNWSLNAVISLCVVAIFG